jgi:septum formation protein
VKLILASGSAARKAILTAAHVPFDAIPADLDEAALIATLSAAGRPPTDLAPELAVAKARKVSQAHPAGLVLGADQTLVFEGEVIGKSRDMQEARALLRRLRGHAHCLVGGMALMRGGSVLWQHSDTARLTMRDFSDRFLEEYLVAEGGNILSCVGCYRLEGPGAQLFERIEGDYFSILGLPLLPLLAELRNQGVLQT